MLAEVNWLEAGGVLFWACAALWILLMGVSVAKESSFFATVVLIAGFLGIAYTRGWGTTVQQVGMVNLIGLVILYFVVGILWSTFKFYTWYRERCMQIKENYADEHPDTKARQTLVEYLEERAPRAYSYKSLIYGWIMFWPLSALLYLFLDLLSDLFNWMWEWFGAVYAKIATSIRDSITKE